jgi:hypothetical protein
VNASYQFDVANLLVNLLTHKQQFMGLRDQRQANLELC